MNEKSTNNNRISKRQKKRLTEAEKDFQRLSEEIRPFVKVRKFKKISTTDKWAESSSLLD